MFIFAIIIVLLLYGTLKTIPSTWNIMPEVIASGDKIMIFGVCSCIVAAIIAILIAIFKYFDGFYCALESFLSVNFIAYCINSYNTIKEESYSLFEAIIGSLILQLQFALPIGIVTIVICAIIRYFKSS